MAPVKYHYGKFPPRDLDLRKLVPLIGPASASLARYDGILSAIPNPNVLLSPLSTQEAVLSSRIEGTQATMKEVLGYEAGEIVESEEKLRDIQEIINYRSAMYKAEKMLKKLPLSLRVIKDIHKTLLKGVRGQNKARGEFRRVPNWIGAPGTNMEEAKFIPISVDKLQGGLDRWERYLHDDEVDILVQLAIIHAEFEALHPFLDGNGRIGRILIPIFLWQKNLISAPTFYISAYFEAHREEYYKRLLAVSSDDEWTKWCEFFLCAVREQAEDNFKKAKKILTLYEEMKEEIPNLTKSQYAIRAVDWLFERPIFKSSDFIASTQIPKPTAYRFLSIFKREKILKSTGKGRGRTPAFLLFHRLLNIVEGKRVF